MQSQFLSHFLHPTISTREPRREIAAQEPSKTMLLSLRMSSSCVGQFRKAFFCAFADEAGVFRIERDVTDHRQVKVLLRLPAESVERAVSLVPASVECAEIGSIRPCME